MALNLRPRLVERVRELKAKRAEMVATAQQQVATLDAQITAAETLATTWDTLTPDQALTLVEQAGLRLEVK